MHTEQFFQLLEQEFDTENIEEIDPVKLWKFYQTSGYQAGPIPHDNVFFTTSVLERFQTGDISTNTKYIISTNSYEGNFRKL